MLTHEGASVITIGVCSVLLMAGGLIGLLVIGCKELWTGMRRRHKWKIRQ